MNKLLLIIILVFSLSSFAQTALEWQKVQMEEGISSKVNLAVSKVLKSNQYMVEVEVKVSDPGPPNFDDMQKVGLKISDVDFDDSKGDYIAFSKVGLEVPVIEKYHNDNQQKLKELHRFNESYNLFKNLDTVDVKVFFSDLLPEEKINQAKKVVENLRFSTGEIKPKIKFDKMSLEMKLKNPLKKPKNEITLKDILTWLSEFGDAFGLIVATVLFGLFAKKLLRLWEEIMQSMIAKREEIENSKEDESEEEETDEEGLLAMEGEDNIFEDLESEDFERFKKFF